MIGLLPSILTKLNNLVTSITNAGSSINLEDISAESANMTSNQVSFDITGTGTFLAAWISQTMATQQAQSPINAYFDIYLDDASTYERVYCASCCEAQGKDGTGNGSGLWIPLSFSERLKIVFNGVYSSSAYPKARWCYGLVYKLDS